MNIYLGILFSLKIVLSKILIFELFSVEMAQTGNTTLSSAFKTFFEPEKLTGQNFNDWFRSLMIVLRVAEKLEYLYKPCPAEPVATASDVEKLE